MTILPNYTASISETTEPQTYEFSLFDGPSGDKIDSSVTQSLTPLDDLLRHLQTLDPILERTSDISIRILGLENDITAQLTVESNVFKI